MKILYWSTETVPLLALSNLGLEAVVSLHAGSAAYNAVSVLLIALPSRQQTHLDYFQLSAPGLQVVPLYEPTAVQFLPLPRYR
jgi:hypothetical protein